MTPAPGPGEDPRPAAPAQPLPYARGPAIQPDFFPRLRLDSVIDGVIAITMTLLVLQLDVPDSLDNGLWPALVELRPKLLSWVISFLIVAQFWVTQVRAMRDVAHIDAWLFRIMVIWLLFVSLMPFSSSLIGVHPDFLGSHIVYAGNLTGVEFAVILRSYHLRRHPELFTPGADVGASQIWARPIAIAVCAALSVSLAVFWAPEFSSVAYGLLIPIAVLTSRRR